MLTALIVDDEKLSVKMLEKIIDWNSFGIQITATAHDGLEALDAFREYKPNIVISDIKMPNLNGLEFIKQVKQFNPETEFILISAYADFDNVKKAIELGCSNYILKPIDEFELEDTLKKVTARISDKKAADKIAVKNRLLQERQVLHRYMNAGTSPLAAAKSANNLGLEFSSFALMSFGLSNNSINDYIENGQQLDGQMNFIMERMTSVLNSYSKCLLFDYEDYGWIAILTNCDLQKQLMSAEAMVSFFAEEIRMDVNICFTDIGQQISDLPQLMKRLHHLSRYSFYVQDERILGYGYNCAESEIDPLQIIAMSKSMTTTLQQNDLNRAAQLLDEVLLVSCKADPNSLHLFFDFYYNMICTIRDKLSDEGRLVEDYRFVLNLGYKDIEQISTVDEMSRLMNRLLALLNKDAKPVKEKYSSLVEAGISYLEENYNCNLSLEDICAHLAVSKNYFCYLFKRDTGQNLWAHLTDIRLNKSKELLSTTELKSYEIAYMVGYDNPSYFSKLFKKCTGKSPNEYRSERK